MMSLVLWLAIQFPSDPWDLQQNKTKSAQDSFLFGEIFIMAAIFGL